jgi:hypothetical protein
MDIVTLLNNIVTAFPLFAGLALGWYLAEARANRERELCRQAERRTRSILLTLNGQNPETLDNTNGE